MNKKLFTILIGVSLIALGISGYYYLQNNVEQNIGATTLKVPNGGTGATSFPVGECLVGNGTGAISSSACASGAGAGTVTSVGMVVPTGLSVSGVPITTSGTGTIAYASGYSIPLTASTTEGSTAYTWGDHATAGYLGETFTSATSTNTLYINQICNSAGECFDSPSAEGSLISFYPANGEADVATYENLFTYPVSGTPVDESCNADADVDGGYCLIDAYISTTTDISILNYPAGTTRIRAYSYVNSATSDSRLVMRGYHRTAAGVETFMGQATSTEINNTAVQEFDFNFTGTEDFAFNVDGTDRLVMKVYGYTTSGTAKTIHWTYQSSGVYSHIVTPTTSADLGYARIYANETITGNWTHSGTTNFTGKATFGNASSTGSITATNFWGTCSKATALVADPTDCSASNYATGIDASGNLTCSIPTGSFTQALASTTFQARTDWTTHDSYPAACGAGLAVGTIGDTSTCINPVASSDATWTLHNSYPAACSANQYVSALGDTNTCSAITSLGTVTAGVWNGTAIGNSYIGSSTQYLSDISWNGSTVANASTTLLSVSGQSWFTGTSSFGYVGIGTSTPKAHLEVNGDILISSYSQGLILTDSNGIRYRLGITTSGELTTTDIATTTTMYGGINLKSITPEINIDAKIESYINRLSLWDIIKLFFIRLFQ